MRRYFSFSIFYFVMFVIGFGRDGNCLQNTDVEGIRRNLIFSSVSISDDALSVLLNPAGLGVGRRFSGYYFHTYSDSSFSGDDAILLASGAFGFSSEWLKSIDNKRARRYTISFGNKISKGIFIGTSYSWLSSKSDSNIHGFSSFDVGLLLRPCKSISIGFVGRDLNQAHIEGERVKRKFEGGLGVRPFGSKMTVFINGKMNENDAFKNAKPSFGIETEVINGIVMRGTFDSKRIGFGLSIGFGRESFGGFHIFNREEKNTEGIIYGSLSSERKNSVFSERGKFLEIFLSGDIVEEKPGFSLFGGKKRTLYRLLETIRRAKENPEISGIILKLEGLNSGMGKIQELRDILLDFRASGKKVVFYFESCGNREYYLACAGDLIAAYPTGNLSLTGIKAEIPFIKGTLEKLGIYADIERRGKYKSAAEIVISDTMSVAFREVENSILDDFYSQFSSGIASGRKKNREEIENLIDKGPYNTREAKEAGLVDTLIFYDEIEKLIENKWKIKITKVNEKDFGSKKFFDYEWDEPKKIALIFATGTILMGESRTDPITGSKVMGGATIARAIKKAREDKSIKAIVFRVDSPGGDGLASDIIWHEVVLTKGKKPIVVSMSDVAGSGGYFISCAGDSILADPGTITGSIGVITGKIVMNELYEKLGVKKEVMGRGKNYDYFSDYKKFSKEQKEILNRQLDEDYKDFVHKVAIGRKKRDSYIDSIAQGRVWTGRQGKENGLVDRLGGLMSAIDVVKNMAGIKKEEKIKLVIMPKGKGGFFDIGFLSEMEYVDKIKKFIEDMKKEELFNEGRGVKLMPMDVVE